MAYKLKLSDDGKPVVADGLPVFVDDNGADVAFNPNTLHAKILSLNSESKARREKIESLHLHARTRICSSSNSGNF